MTQKDYTMRVLHADEGMVLTQKADVDIMERVISDEVYLAATDTPDNWKEITVEVARQIEQEQMALSDAAAAATAARASVTNGLTD